MIYNKSYFFIFLILLNKSLLKEESESNEKLLFVWEHFRHGARGSYKSFDYINWKDILDEKWKGTGELTPIGMRMHYLLGVATRKKYQNFLSLNFEPNEIYIISTNINRTLISAYSNLQGIFYKSSKDLNINEKKIKKDFILNQNYSKQLKNEINNLNSIEKTFNAFPVHIYNQKDLKFQLYRTEVCPGISTYLQKIKKTEGIQNIYNNILTITNEYFGKYIFKFMNISMDKSNYLYNFENVNTICDTFIADYVDGRKMEKIKNTGINLEQFYDHCLNISLVTSYYNYYGNPLEKTLEFGVSPTFKEIFDYMDKRILLDKNGMSDKVISSSPKFVIVSSHDISLAAFDLFLESKFSIPFKRADYANNQIFELWKNIKNGKYFIKYLINLEEVATFDYYEFKNKVSSELYSEKEIRKICFPDSLSNITNENKPNYYLYLFIIFIFLVFILILYLIKIKKREKSINFIKQNPNIEMKQMNLFNNHQFE